MIAALIISAGRTGRMDNFQPLAEVGTISAIQRVVMVFQLAGVKRIVVVCSNDISRFVAHMNVVYLSGNEDAQMLDNVKIGLDYLSNKCTAAMITHVGVPLFSVETVQTLMSAQGTVCIPSHSGKAGHPMLLRSEHFRTVLSYDGDGGLAGAVKASGLQCNYIEVVDEGVLANVRNTQANEQLISGHSLMELRHDIKIRIAREKPFYGPGSHHLLQLTSETSSLREACRNMGISYSKGRKIIALMEQQFGERVIESKQGGKAGGRSVVTEKGLELMRNYAEFCSEANHKVGELFVKYFGDGDKRKSTNM